MERDDDTLKAGQWLAKKIANMRAWPRCEVESIQAERDKKLRWLENRLSELARQGLYKDNAK